MQELDTGLIAKAFESLKMDNWKHRSKNMKCLTCMFFVVKEVDLAKDVNLGRCRRHAPAMSGFPAVFTTDWCGDHKIDENKL